MTEQALLVMDVQNGIVERYGEGDESLLSTLGQAVSGARAAGVAVIFVRVAFREGAPEVNPRNAMFARLAGSPSMSQEAPETQVHAALGAHPDDIVVVKKRVSAFSGSDLEVVLRSLGVERLVLTGIATSGVVLSTLRQAADMDYGLTVCSDGCADSDTEVQRVLTEKVFPRQAEVTTTNQWLEALGS
jgi:nicotinamidase-related amidase